MTVHRIQRLRCLLELVLTKHLTNAVEELTAAVDDELEARTQDRVSDLRQQLEQKQGKQS